MIDEEKYVREADIDTSEPAEKLDGMEYVIIRTYSAGVHAGYLASKDGTEVVLKQSRRIHYWDGAASLSELAMKGTAKPDECRVPCAVNEITLWAIEIIPCTKKARQSITDIAEWTAQ